MEEGAAAVASYLQGSHKMGDCSNISEEARLDYNLLTTAVGNKGRLSELVGSEASKKVAVG